MSLAKEATRFIRDDEVRDRVFHTLTRMADRLHNPPQSDGEKAEHKVPIIKKVVTENFLNNDDRMGAVLTSWTLRQTSPTTLTAAVDGKLDLSVPKLKKSAAISAAEANSGLLKAKKSLQRKIATPGGASEKKLKRLAKGVDKNLADPDHPGKTAGVAGTRRATVACVAG